MSKIRCKPSQNIERKTSIISHLKYLKSQLEKTEGGKSAASKIEKIIADKEQELKVLLKKCADLIIELNQLLEGTFSTDIDKEAIEKCIEELDQLIYDK